ncbi:MAG: hypothetical protein RIR18_880 [Pseudomonadota bacterium]|jgi:tRNA threonylcarbamoyladenosine biosynthesis protein TsaE
MNLYLPDEAATQALGAALAKALELSRADPASGLRVFLEGDLGAGKTSLVRALLYANGHVGPVKSPTYSLIETYDLDGRIFHHFDFYRFESADEFLEAGLEEYFQDGATCLVEWPDKAGQFLPKADLVLELSHEPVGRKASIRAISERGQACLDFLE